MMVKKYNVNSSLSEQNDGTIKVVKEYFNTEVQCYNCFVNVHWQSPIHLIVVECSTLWKTESRQEQLQTKNVKHLDI